MLKKMSIPCSDDVFCLLIEIQQSKYQLAFKLSCNKLQHSRCSAILYTFLIGMCFAISDKQL